MIVGRWVSGLLGPTLPGAPFMTVEINEQNEAHGHEHKDVSGGWLRPAVFGAMDGLVTNVSLIAGVGAGVGVAGGSPHLIVLTGLAGLAAGAFSMATGEYVSVSSQNELIQAEVRKEAHELKYNAESERMELAASFRSQGVDADLADQRGGRLAGHLRARRADPAAALPARAGQPGGGAGPGRGGRVRRRRPGGPAYRPAVPAWRAAPAHPGRRRGRDHVPDRQRGRRRGVLTPVAAYRPAHPDAPAHRWRPTGRLPG